MRKSFLIIFFFIIQIPLFANKEQDELIIKEAVDELNKLLDYNNTHQDKKYFLDLRHGWATREKDAISSDKALLLNSKSEKISTEYELDYFTIILDFISEQDEEYVDHFNVTTIFYKGKVYRFKEEEMNQKPELLAEYNQLIASIKADNERLRKERQEYITGEIAERSNLSKAKNKGLLLAVYCDLHFAPIKDPSEKGKAIVYYPQPFESYQESEKHFFENKQVKYEINPVIALGNRLNAAAVFRSAKISNMVHSDDRKPFFEIVDAYLDQISVSLSFQKQLYGENFFSTEQYGITAENIIYEYQAVDSDIIESCLLGYSAPSPSGSLIVRDIYIEDKVVLRDFAGISKCDVNFNKSLVKVLPQDSKGIDLSQFINVKEHNTLIITTSDANTDRGKSAIQILAEDQFGDFSEYDIVVAIHFRLDRSNLNSEKLIAQTVIQFSEELQESIAEERSEDEQYAWYKNTVTGEIVHGVIKLERLTDYNNMVVIPKPWEKLGKYRVNSFHYSDFSTNPIANACDERYQDFNNYMMEHGEEVGQAILEIAFTAATGGTGGILLAASSMAFKEGMKYVAKETAKKMAAGMVIDALLQTGIIMLFADEKDNMTFDKALTQINPVQMCTAGVTNLFDTKFKDEVLIEFLMAGIKYADQANTVSFESYAAKEGPQIAIKLAIMFVLDKTGAGIKHIRNLTTKKVNEDKIVEFLLKARESGLEDIDEVLVEKFAKEFNLDPNLAKTKWRNKTGQGTDATVRFNGSLSANWMYDAAKRLNIKIEEADGTFKLYSKNSSTTPFAEITQAGEIKVNQWGASDMQPTDEFRLNTNYIDASTSAPKKMEGDLVVGKNDRGECGMLDGSRGCFLAGTKILTKSGLQNIENLAVGDWVVSYNSGTKEAELKQVTKTFSRKTNKVVQMVFGRDTIYTTPEHPFWQSGKWMNAANLRSHDVISDEEYSSSLLLLSNHRARSGISVDDIQIRHQTSLTYNFEVEGNHNYYVGTTNILVHNTSCAQNFCRTYHFNKLKSTFPGISDDICNKLIDLGIDIKTITDNSGFYNTLIRDLGDPSFFNKFEKRHFDAWYTLRKAGKADHLRTNIQLLNKIDQILTSSNNFSLDKAKLAKIFENNESLKNAVKTVTVDDQSIQINKILSEEELLDCLIQLISSPKTNGAKVVRDLLGDYRKYAGADFVLRLTKNRWDDVEGFEIDEMGNGDRFTDIIFRSSPSKIECKSWKTFSTDYYERTAKEFAEDLNNNTNINSFSWVFDAKGGFVNQRSKEWNYKMLDAQIRKALKANKGILNTVIQNDKKNIWFPNAGDEIDDTDIDGFINQYFSKIFIIY